MSVVEKLPHTMPKDLEIALNRDKKVFELWQKVTPLGKNEFYCWVTSPKQRATREKRIRRTVEELLEGKRRPCCWPGCPHRPGHPKKVYTAGYKKQ
jgi:uncharacterized protein YdeI (YjbR/CyaY-like superfamily)